jgi:purine-binding chemotaxis protein CheW
MNSYPGTLGAKVICHMYLPQQRTYSITSVYTLYIIECVCRGLLVVILRYNEVMEAEQKEHEHDAIASELFFEKVEESAPTRELLLVELDGELYSVAVAEIEMVMKIPPVTAVPNAPEAIVGIFHLRGRVIVALDLLKRMGLTRTTSLIPYYLFVVRREKNYFGVLIDRTRTVVRIPESEIKPLDNMTAAHVPERYVKGTFLYKDKITNRTRSRGSSIMIEPIGASETLAAEPVILERPVIILELATLLDEQELRGESAHSGESVSSTEVAASQ